MMKKISLVILPLLFAPIISTTACVYNNGINDKKDFTITAVKLNVEKIEIRVGNEPVSIVATIEATGEYSDAISLSIQDTSVAILDKSEIRSGESFYVGALKEGKTTLTATSKGDTSKTVSIPVTILEEDPVIPVESVLLDKEEESLYVGKTSQLTPTILPLNATNQLVKWESSDEEVAKVDSNGLVTGIDEGVVTIKCTSVDGGYYATCDYLVSIEIEVNAYYLNGTPNLWMASGSYKLEKNIYSESNNEYMVKFSAKSDDEFKVAKFLADETYTYFPMAHAASGVRDTIQDSIELNYGKLGNIHVIKDGQYTLYFDLNVTDGTNYKYWIEPGHAQ